MKDHFDVYFTVVDSTSESLNLIKRTSAVNVSQEQFLFEFFYCFGQIGNLKNTHHTQKY